MACFDYWAEADETLESAEYDIVATHKRLMSYLSSIRIEPLATHCNAIIPELESAMRAYLSGVNLLEDRVKKAISDRNSRLSVIAFSPLKLGGYLPEYILISNERSICIFEEGTYRYARRNFPNIGLSPNKEKYLTLSAIAREKICHAAVHIRGFLEECCTVETGYHHSSVTYNQNSKYVLHIGYHDGGFFIWSSNDEQSLSNIEELFAAMQVSENIQLSDASQADSRI